MPDTARIHALVRRGRRRLRTQAALEGAALAAVAASAVALILVYLVRRGALDEGLAPPLIAGVALAIVAIGALLGAVRRIPTALVATRIDRASGLADRLASACAFERDLSTPAAAELPAETRAMMQAAVADAIRHADRADVRAATPLRWPRDGRAALAFAAVAAVVAGLYIEAPLEDPRIAAIRPPAAPRKVPIDLTGERLCPAACEQPVEVLFGAGEATFAAATRKKTSRLLVVEVPPAAPVGKTFVRVRAGGRTSWPRPFEILADGDRRYQPVDRVALDDDDMAFARDLLQDLNQTAADMQDPELKEFADKVEALLDQADKGELSKEQLLDALAQAEKKYMEGAKPEEVDRAMAELGKTGKELKKDDLTRPIGEALEKGDLAKAQEEMNKLAEKLAKGELSDKQRAEAAKALDKAAEAFDKREEAQKKDLDKQIEKARAEQKQAEKERDAAKDERDKERLARKAEDRRRKAEALEQKKQEQEASEQRRTLKRLHRNMKKAAEEMDKDQEQQENRRQASRTMEDMARDTGKVDADKRKMAHQKKTQSQLDDLREAMRRAKKGGSQGAKDRFGKNRRNQDFERRARGGRGSKSAWQRGQGGKGQGQGQGQGQQPGGQGQQPGGDSYGDGTDPDVMGEATARQGNTKDQDLQGSHGKGPSTRETILSAAQKGFSSRSYSQEYGKYKTIVEEVMRAEKVPSGYKFYVKKYFQKIKPHAM
jgi:hypothetical protein